MSLKVLFNTLVFHLFQTTHVLISLFVKKISLLILYICLFKSGPLNWETSTYVLKELYPE